MNIVVITHTTPNLPHKDGETTVLYHLLEQLRLQHTITVFAMDQYEASEQLIEAVSRKLDTTDVLYLHGHDAARLITSFKQEDNIVVGYIDAQSSKYQQLADYESNYLRKKQYQRQAKEWLAFEQTDLTIAHTVIVTTEADQQALAKVIGGKTFIAVIANGVDTEYFHPDPTVQQEHAIVFSGVLDQPTHVQAILRFAKDVWPTVKLQSKRPPKWYIVGRNPDKRIEKLTTKDDLIHVSGFVPEVREYLLRCKLFVSPLHIRSGIRNTILEAMSTGLPVVAYAEACQGLETSPIHKVQTETDFAKTIVEWLEHSETQKIEAERNRQYVEKHHIWEKQVSAYENIFIQAKQVNAS